MSFYEEAWRRERPLGRFTRLRGCVYLTNPPPLEQWERVEKVKMPTVLKAPSALKADGKAPITAVDRTVYTRGTFVRFDWLPVWRAA